MIQLLRLRIKNYKSLVDTDIRLRSDLTALIGKNGAGKTNTLNSILLLRQIRGIDPFLRHEQITRAMQDSAHAVLYADFKIDGLDYAFKADLYFDITDDSKINYSELSIKNLNKSGTRFVKVPPEAFSYLNYVHMRELDMNGHTHYLTSDTTLNEALYKLSSYFENISYYSATQFSDPSKSPIFLELEDKKLNARRYSSRRSHESFLYDLFTTWSTDKQAFRRYHNVVGALGLRLVDKIDFAEHELPRSSIKVFAGGQYKKISSKRTIAIPTFTVNDLQLSPTQLSEGTFKTLALVYYILNDSSDLILIEEPEVCVHHGLLGNIIELIKAQSKHKQIVISTHSDYVVDKLKPENIVLIEKGHKGTIANTLNKKLSQHDYEALHMYLGEIGNLGQYWKESGFGGDED